MSDMSFADAFTVGYTRSQEATARGDQPRTFDWDKAYELLQGVDYAEAGLQGDWNYTGGCIWRDGKPYHDDYTYLTSMWAQPTLRIGDVDTPCWKYTTHENWAADAKWPNL